MRDKGILKILAISVILAVVVSSVAVFSAANLDIGISEKGIDEGGGKGVISLVPPPFIGVAGASESEVSMMREGANFLEEEAGDEDEKCLANENHYSLYKPSIPKYKLNEQIIQAAGNEKSNNTFSIHGNISLLWSYIDDKKEAKVDFDALDDINGDGIVDVLLYDRNSGGKVLVVSGKDGSTIWSKICPTWIESIERFDDVNGDGINDAIAYWKKYDPDSYITNIMIELLNGSNGERIWSKEISHFGEVGVVQVRGTQEMRECYGSLDLNGDGIEDILVEVVEREWFGGRKRDVAFFHALNGRDGSNLWERTSGHGLGHYGWGDGTGDGIDDLVITSGEGLESQMSWLSVINGSDGSIVWEKTFLGDYKSLSWPTFSDFDGDGIKDILIGEVNLGDLGLFVPRSKVFAFKGTNSSLIWSKSFDKNFFKACSLGDITGDGIEEIYLEFKEFKDFTLRTVEIQVVNGRDGSLIWKKDINVPLLWCCKDMNGDNVDEFLLSNSIGFKIEGTCCFLQDIFAISGADGSKIWRTFFGTKINESGDWVDSGTSAGGVDDLNGDNIIDPILSTSYLSKDDSSYKYAERLFVMNGVNGSEICHVEYSSAKGYGLNLWTGDDFNKDGIKDILLGTGKGVYLVIIELMNDTIPPVIADVSVINITNNSAMITWRTDEFADSVVKYGENSTVYTKMCTDELFVKEHTITLTGLSPDTTYYFVVNSTDRSGNSAESLEYRFETSVPLPLAGVAILIAPFGDIYTRKPTYTWYEVENSTRYHLRIKGPSGRIFDQWYNAEDVCSGGTCSVTPSKTLDAGKYTWWVQAWNPTRLGPWSYGIKFELPLPSEPCFLVPASRHGIFVSPVDVINLPDGDVKFGWYYKWRSEEEKDNTQFYLQINGGGFGQVFDQWYKAKDVCSDLDGGCSATPNIKYLSSGYYTWRVRAWNPIGYGPWSENGDFKVVRWW